MAADRIGVLDYKVRATPVGGAAQTRLLTRLSVMTSEVARLQSAIARLRHAVQANQGGEPLVSALMDSRNWALSVLASHSYAQEMLGPSGATPHMGKTAAMAARGDARNLGPAGSMLAARQLADYREAERDSRVFPAVQLPALSDAAVKVGIEDATRDRG